MIDNEKAYLNMKASIDFQQKKKKKKTVMISKKRNIYENLENTDSDD